CAATYCGSHARLRSGSHAARHDAAERRRCRISYRNTLHATSRSASTTHQVTLWSSRQQCSRRPAWSHLALLLKIGELRHLTITLDTSRQRPDELLALIGVQRLLHVDPVYFLIRVFFTPAILEPRVMRQESHLLPLTHALRKWQIR